jgi:hypothetical protein
MNALVIEPYSPATYGFIDGLNHATHCRVRHVETIEEGLRAFEEVHFDLVIVSIDQRSPPGSAIAERIKSRAAELNVRCPYVILLFSERFPMSDAQKCRDMDSIYLRHDYPLAVYDEAQLAFRRFATKKHNLTIRVEFRSGHHFLYVGSSSIPVGLGTQLTKLAVLLLSGRDCYPVEFLADELGVCRQSIKKYFFELRRAFVRAPKELGIGSQIAEEFWMEKRAGGTVCGVRANTIWN